MVVDEDLTKQIASDVQGRTVVEPSWQPEGLRGARSVIGVC